MEENNQPDSSSQDHDKTRHESHRQPHQLFSDHEPSLENDEPSPPQSAATPTEPPQPPVPASALPPQSPQPPTPAYNNPPFTQPSATASHDHPPTSAGQIVLQWLTYAFWGWTVLGVSILSTTVLANIISHADTGSFVPYGIASVLVLLPIAIVCDVFYSKHEPAKKAGASSVVMVIHAVLFALFGIGALIGIVISLVTMFTSSGDSSAEQVALFSTMIITLLYGAVFLRTINPARTPWIRRFFPIFMAILVGVITIMGILGPVANARLTRNDRLISDNISDVQRGVTDYSTANNKLPDSLSNLKLSGDAKKLVDDNLVTYKPNSKPPTSQPDSYSSTYYGNSNSPSGTGASTTTKIYYYQLCVNYKKTDGGSTYDYGSDSQQPNNTYQSYISAYTHPEGNVCYNLKTSDY